MIYSSLISIPVILLFLVGTFFIGKYLTESNQMFANNPFAGWVLGFIINFGMTMFVFFVFTWASPSVIYFTIVYFIKEFIVYAFLIIRRDRFIKGINWKVLGWTIVSGLIIMFAYNFGIKEYTGNGSDGKASLFNTWFEIKDVVNYYAKVGADIVSDWVFGFVSATVIYSVVASFFVEISKKHNHWTYLQALIMTLIIMTVMSIGVSASKGAIGIGGHIGLTDSVGFFLLPFMVLISMRLVMFSRRRYGAIFGITSFVAWSIDPKSLLAITVLAFITTMVYTYMRKPRASLFWVQLVTPQLMLLSLELYRVSIVLAIVIFILSTILYIFMLRLGGFKLLTKLNQYVDKGRVIIPAVILGIMYITSIITINIDHVGTSWFDMDTTHSVLYSNIENSRISTYIQLALYAILIIFLIIKTLQIVRSKKPTLVQELLIIFSLLTIVFVYNPLVNRMFQSTFVRDYFGRIMYISIVPILLLGSSKIKRAA